jgi:hypothetical protein
MFDALRKCYLGRVRLLLTIVFASASAYAQRGSSDLRGTVGYASFIDESSVDHLFTGMSFRHYLLPRLSLEPELVFLYRDNTDKDVGFQVNIVWDLRKPSRVVPYAIGGIGLLHTILRPVEGPAFSTTNKMYNGGFGVKVYINDRWFVAPEARIGFEPIVRFTASAGYSWR